MIFSWFYYREVNSLFSLFKKIKFLSSLGELLFEYLYVKLVSFLTFENYVYNILEYGDLFV